LGVGLEPVLGSHEHGLSTRANANKLSMRVIIGLLGPAFVAAIAYVDPGNFATNISAGAGYGYLLLWVLVVANLMACLMQYLSAKIGLVTGQSLPEIIRDHLSNKVRIAYWLQAELVAIATDIAEVLGGAIALQLLFNIPLLLGGIITGAVSMLLLFIHGKRGQKTFERITIGLLLIIPIGFIAGLEIKPPHAGAALHGLLPLFAGQNSILLATGIIGATVMPHVIYLHSALARDRHGKVEPRKIKGLLRATRIDVGVAMLIAGGVNIVMLLLAASALMSAPNTGSLSGAYQALGSLVSPAIATLFAVGLLASGLAAASVGCYAGSVVMQGLLRQRIPMVFRRLATLIPALVIISVGINPTKALVLSQVVLSFAIPFAIIPLVKISSNKKVMGIHANHVITTVVAWIFAGAIVGLNIFLVATSV
jgi:manganese transport protein